MSNRDDFSLKTKQTLAERVSFLCSFPGCFITTVGPSEESLEAVSNTGMACHITAAAKGKGARRYVGGLSSEERCSIENGIWMCYRHGKLIDTDEIRFTIEMLKTWKLIAERRAQIILENGSHVISPKSFIEIPIPETSFVIPQLVEENRIIGESIDDSCIPIIWGEDIAHAVRDFIIEICRNSLSHGKAKQFTVEINQQEIKLSDDGENFNQVRLLNSNSRSGGTDAVKNLSNGFGKNILLTSWRESNVNKLNISLVRSQEDVLKLNPCSFKFPNGQLTAVRPIEADFKKDCNTVYFVLPDYCTLSDIYGLKYVLMAL